MNEVSETVTTTYEQVTNLVHTWGTVYFFILFAIVLVYALRPSSRKSFDEAANIPLKED